MAKGITLPEAFARRQWQHEWEDDFDWFVTGHRWEALAADGGSSVAEDADGEGGIVTLATGATNNNEAGLFSRLEKYQFQADCALYAAWRAQFSEQATDDANIAFGFADAAGADLLGDDGAGDAINSSGALIFKIDGETTWRCAVEINGTVYETQTNFTAGGSSYQWLEIRAFDVDGSNLEVTYFVDGYQLRDTNDDEIVHRIAFASSTQMDFVAGYVKAGGATSETLNLDYACCVSRRTT